MLGPSVAPSGTAERSSGLPYRPLNRVERAERSRRSRDSKEVAWRVSYFPLDRTAKGTAMSREMKLAVRSAAARLGRSLLGVSLHWVGA
jgi:hypothetical protein